MALRTPLSVTPHLYMGDSTGRPLDKGVVYFGEQDKDPEFYPINLFSDDALTLPLAQPVHTKGGYLYDKGDMVEPHAKEIIYSVKVLDSYGRKVFYKGAMMRNSWNDDVIEQINAALVSTAEQSAQIATDVAKEIADKAVVSSGFVTIDSFELGATLTQRNQALRHTADGKLYRWAGDLPKVVPASSTPANSGGIGANAWLEVSDVALRQDLANPDKGAAMVARAVQVVDSIAELRTLPTSGASEYAETTGYYQRGDGGGGLFYVADTIAGLVDDGGSVVQADDGGFWLLSIQNAVSIRQFGARSVKEVSGFDSTSAILRAASRASKPDVATLIIDAGEFILKQTLDLYNYCELQYNEYYGLPSYKTFDIRGAGRYKSKLIWKGGPSEDGKRGTAIILRSKTLRNGVPEIGDYLGTVTGFELTTEVERQHSGGWSLTPKFTTTSSEYAGIQLKPHESYPTLIDKQNTDNNLASCGIYFNGLNSVIEGLSVSGFAYGIWAGQGYGTSIRNNFLEFNLCALSLRDAITTTTVESNIIHRNAVGILFWVCDKIRVVNNAVQGNYGGADFVLETWNANLEFQGNYSEASPRNVVIDGDSAGQYRNKKISFIGNVGLQLYANLLLFEELYLRSNHIEACEFFGSTSDHCVVVVEDNFNRLPEESELDYLPFTEWNIPDKHLDDRGTLPNSKLTNAIREGSTSGRIVGPLRHSKKTSARADVLELRLPNETCSGVLRIKVARAATDNPASVLFGEYLISWNRVAGSWAVMEIKSLSSNTLSSRETGTLPGALTFEAVVGGYVSGENIIPITDLGAAEGLEGFTLYEVEVMSILGGYALKRL